MKKEIIEKIDPIISIEKSTDREKELIRMVKPLVKFIADWERENGIYGALMEMEYKEFLDKMKKTGMNTNCRGFMSLVDKIEKYG